MARPVRVQQDPVLSAMQVTMLWSSKCLHGFQTDPISGTPLPQIDGFVQGYYNCNSIANALKLQYLVLFQAIVGMLAES